MNRQDKGEFGEKITAEHLKRAGFKIIRRNFRCRHGEIDIIAENKDYILFVEVKTRSFDCFGRPAEAVGKAKKRHLIYAAEYYLVLNPTDKQPRFDVSEVILSNNDQCLELNYIEDAFSAE